MIAPGSANPLMWGQADPLDELGKVDRSVRLRAAASAYFSRTLIGGTSPADTSLLKKLYSFNVKRGKLGSVQLVLTNSYASDIHWDFFFDANDAFCVYHVYTTIRVNLISTAVFRDPNQHLNIIILSDLTQPVAADRVKVLVNGIQITMAGTFPAQNNATSSFWLTPTAGSYYVNIGNRAVAGAGSFQFDGLVSNVIAVDSAAALNESVIGQFHPLTRQWRPYGKARVRANIAAGGGPRNGWGVSGFLLDFADASSVSALGYDHSQTDTDTTGNNFTVSNVSLTPGPTYDSLTDTPTANYAVVNAINPRGSSTVSDGGLKEVCGASVLGRGSSIAMTAGRWRAQATINGASGGPGQAWLAAIVGVVPVRGSATFTTVGVGYDSYSGQKYVSGAISAYGSVWRTNGATYVIDIDLNIDAGYVEFYLDGVAQGQITLPAAIDGWVFKWDWFSIYGGGNATWNFGQQPWTHSILPSVKGPNTKAIPQPVGAARNPATAFVAVTGSGANVLANLASARSSFGSFIDIAKRRDAAEGWRFSFSDDAGFALDSSSNTAGRFAYPALAGSSYVAYSLRVEPSNGVATGRFTHPGGTSVIADGLARSRKVVILTNEAGSNWWVYHPELTAGRLLYLNGNNAETVDASINSVNSSGFSITVPAGNYRWIALAEIEGVISLFRAGGNGSADGTWSSTCSLPAAVLMKRFEAGTFGWVMFDKARDPMNPASSIVQPNSSNAESLPAGVAADFVSGGVKARGADGGMNASGGIYAGIAFADFHHRFANAR